MDIYQAWQGTFRFIRPVNVQFDAVTIDTGDCLRAFGDGDFVVAWKVIRQDFVESLSESCDQEIESLRQVN